MSSPFVATEGDRNKEDQYDQERGKGDSIQREALAIPITPISTAAQHRPAKPSHVELNGVQGKGAMQLAFWDETWHDRKKHRTVQRPYDPFQKRNSDNDEGRCQPQESCERECRAKDASRRLQNDEPGLAIHAIRDYSREQREDEHWTEVGKLQHLDVKALMRIAVRLVRNRPALGRVFSPVTGIGNERPDPEEQKRPVSEDVEGAFDGRD